MRTALLSCVLGLLAAWCLPALAAPEPVADLGRVLYVGDSITHGKSSGSWRWELHKIFVDNGVRQQEVGIQRGNYNGRGGIAPGTRYRGVPFANVHAAQFSEKAAEVAGRLSEPARMGGTGIRHWLRLEGAAADGTWQLAEGETPDTLFIALGTNDFVAEHSAEAGGLAKGLPTVQAQLIGRKQGKSWSGTGDMDTIVDAMREANPKARIVAVGVPTFSDSVGRWCHKAITDKDYEAVQEYNRHLREWGKWKKLTAVIDMNAGFRDVRKQGAAVATMLVDQMHPNAQGNLIYAGNVAKQLGYAGRTAGLKRRAAEDFPPLPESARTVVLGEGKAGIRVSPKGNRKVFLGTGSAQGATLELQFREKGRMGDPVLVPFRSAGQGSQLEIRADGLFWGNSCLYSAETPVSNEPVRLAWVAGNAAEGIAGGFYVWLGDMLVGEALAGRPDNADGGPDIIIGQGSSPLNIVCDPAAAWAPPTQGFSASSSDTEPHP